MFKFISRIFRSREKAEPPVITQLHVDLNFATIQLMIKIAEKMGIAHFDTLFEQAITVYHRAVNHLSAGAVLCARNDQTMLFDSSETPFERFGETAKDHQKTRRSQTANSEIPDPTSGGIKIMVNIKRPVMAMINTIYAKLNAGTGTNITAKTDQVLALSFACLQACQTYFDASKETLGFKYPDGKFVPLPKHMYTLDHLED